MGKLDTITVNGPEDDVLDWDAVDWRQAEDDVRRLRQRIFTASKAGDLKKVRNLQKLMLRSRANALLSVRRVTEVNAGRKTAGVDGGRAGRPGEGRDGRLAPARRGRVEAQARQAGVHPQGRRKTARARDSRDRRQGASGPDGGGAGARVGGPVRVPIVWVPAGPLLPGRDAGHLRDRTREDLQAPVGAGRRPGRRVRPHRSFPPPRPARHLPRPGTGRGSG